MPWYAAKDKVARARVGDRLARKAHGDWEEGPEHILQCVALHCVPTTEYYSGYQINAYEKIVGYVKYSEEGTYWRDIDGKIWSGANTGKI